MPDYIVVGGGSAGSVVAARLSEDPDASVLLLEQGNRDLNPYIHLPVTYYKTNKSNMMFRFDLEPSVAQGGKASTMVQAKVLGGGSSINGMVYIRGCPEDYDGWERGGCDGWSYREVLPYFKRAEDNETLAGEAHGTGGPLGVSDPRFVHPLTKDWLKACQEAGMPYNRDFNSGTQAGCGLYQVTIRDGVRSSAVSYLRAARGRANLKVQTRVRVVRIVVERGRAVGVEYRRGDRSVTVRAEREVVVCSGAVNSPHLLLRSGIGPADHLRAMGVAVVHDLPGVGQNLQDHMGVQIVSQLNGPNSYDKYKKLHWQAWAGLQYALFRSGPVASNIIEAGGFWYGDKSDPLPDLQFAFLPGAGIEQGIDDVPGGNGCTIDICQTRPYSRGAVRLRSSDPEAPPSIDPRYLSDHRDVLAFVAGIKLMQDVMRQPSIARHVSREHQPGRLLETQSDYEAFIREAAQGAIHPTGTCKMGVDPLAVVDPQLRVRGIDGLRVADTSIMPSLPSGNTNAPAIMVGERAADFIQGNRARRSFAGAATT